MKIQGDRESHAATSTHVAQAGDQSVDPAFPNLDAFGFFDRVDMLLLEPERQTIE
jgi:hypothetical protein